ncbi:hypothetical protein MTO96_008614 [Rhipicephalus appendiculatus]
MLIQFLEQHPYLGRASTEVSPRMTSARKKQLWDEIAAQLNEQGPAIKSPPLWRSHRATGGGKVGGIHGGGAVVAAAPRVLPHPRRVPSQPQATAQPGPSQPGPSQLGPSQPGLSQPQPRRGQPLEDAVSRAVAAYERQSQSADRRALADQKFQRKLLEQTRHNHEAQIASLGRLENQFGRLTEQVGRLRLVQQQRLDQERRAQESTQRLLQQLLEALASSAAPVARRPQPPSA